MVARGAQAALVALVCAALVINASAGFVFTRTNTTTSTSKDSSTSLGKIKACAAVKTFSKGGGFVRAWANANAQGINAAAAVCSSAVADAFADACDGANSIASVSAAAEACASATAKVYVSTMVKATASGNAKACLDTCGLANANAQAVARAAASAIANATVDCASVQIFVNSTVFATAMVSANAEVLTAACVEGEGKLWAQANSMVSGLANSYAKVFAAALAKACTCANKGCKCAPIPAKAKLEDLAVSDTYSSVASGRRALTQSVADAAAQFCDGSSTIEAAVKTVVDATVKVYTSALVTVQATLKVQGNAKGCTKAKGELDLLGVSSAVGEALADAFTTNFAGSCGAAASHARNAAFSQDVSQLLYNATASSCGKKGEIVKDDVEKQLTTRTPVAKAITEVFSLVKRTCQCKGACWCGTSCDAASYCPSFTLTGYGAPIGRRRR